MVRLSCNICHIEICYDEKCITQKCDHCDDFCNCFGNFLCDLCEKKLGQINQIMKNVNDITTNVEFCADCHRSNLSFYLVRDFINEHKYTDSAICYTCKKKSCDDFYECSSCYIWSHFDDMTLISIGYLNNYICGDCKHIIKNMNFIHYESIHNKFLNLKGIKVQTLGILNRLVNEINKKTKQEIDNIRKNTFENISFIQNTLYLALFESGKYDLPKELKIEIINFCDLDMFCKSISAGFVRRECESIIDKILYE